MGTKTIGLDDEAYDRLEAQKREDESFSDTVKRIAEEVAADWRHSIGTYDGDRAEAFADAVERSHETTNRRRARWNTMHCGLAH
jgi:predicted CopG family antitoxin